MKNAAPLLLLCAALGCASPQQPTSSSTPVTTTPSAPATAATPAPINSQLEFDRANLDTSVNACTDFYQYANGTWLAKNPIPPQFTSWGMSSGLSESNRNALHEVLEAAAAKPAASRTANEQKIGDFWTSCMNEPAIEQAGITPLQPELDRINQIASLTDLQAEIARLHAMNVDNVFDFHSIQDAKNSTEVIGEISQSGLGLPDRDYYFKPDRQAIREEYVKHVAAMLRLAGDDEATAAKGAETVMRIETALANASMTRVEQRDPNALYNRMPVTQLAGITPAINWPLYFRQMGVASLPSINVAQPKFFAEVNRQLTSTSLDDWKTYLRWHLLTAEASTLSSPFVNENFRFRSTVLTGQKEQQPRWKRCVARADQLLGEALGQAYVDKKFPPAAKRRATELVDNLIAALRSDLGTLDWMSPATRQAAVAKLEAMTRKIGYPDQWRDYSQLRIADGPFVTNVLAGGAFGVRRDLDKIGRPLDRSEWGMTPPTINAYNDGALNEIVFPAGILQWPFFDANMDDAFNYGSIGSIIGHEITHGFDDEGSQYDARGNLRNWWTDQDKKKFEERAECIVRQFDGYYVEPGLHHNGKLVAGESIADLGGLVIAYAAWQRSLEGKPRPQSVDGFTPEQRFFLGFARSRASNTTPEALRVRINTDPHPASKYRVNGPLSNMPQFATAFACKSNDAMVRAERCNIW
ncbi:MAG: M13 family metallopeptidase [Acidobacteria bacterium]|nr:M13 family metallopeptidase [Acidobacteriota bacterium]